MAIRTKPGFTIIEAVLIFVVAGVITAVGLTYFNSLNSQKSTITESSSQAAVDPVPAVDSASGIDDATTDLDSLDIDDADDASQLDQQQAAF